ncbi:MAG: transketolase C-terminal domain-containing protein, partial [Lutibacter sp.]|nr:transketolase C-terminal domain-containing protein [Lutibacter sp.]
YGAGVHWALNEVKLHNISADVIDLRTLQPLDTEAIYKSVKKTGKALILQEDTLFGGIASDLSALITENCFNYLDAPVKRVGSIESPIPFAKNLEEMFLPKNRLYDSIVALINY